jgi:hypothetical protein
LDLRAGMASTSSQKNVWRLSPCVSGWGMVHIDSTADMHTPITGVQRDGAADRVSHGSCHLKASGGW